MEPDFNGHGSRRRQFREGEALAEPNARSGRSPTSGCLGSRLGGSLAPPELNGRHTECAYNIDDCGARVDRNEINFYGEPEQRT